LGPGIHFLKPFFVNEEGAKQGDQKIWKKSPKFSISSQNINIKPLETSRYLTANHVLKLFTQVKT